MSENNLKAKIRELENVLEAKEQEVLKYLDKIEELEETLMKLESLISDENSKSSKKKWKKAKDSLLEMDLEEKEKIIRNLKDRMGFLRKEKIQLQRKLEQYTKEKSNSTIIRIEEKKEPFETLVKELQDKINKQQILISELNIELKIKNDKIHSLNNTILGLETKQQPFKDKYDVNPPKNIVDSLTEELQRKLNRAKLEIKDLQQQLEDYKIWKAPINENSQNEIIRELRNKLERITAQENTISDLNKISNQNIDLSSENPDLALRIRELKNLIEDLKTQNIQQRLEISKLRKK